jgi:hypothetical protein
MILVKLEEKSDINQRKKVTWFQIFNAPMTRPNPPFPNPGYARECRVVLAKDVG